MKGGRNMIYKKAQSQIITTVLIILLVLAAIVIVWQVVQSTITGGAESIRDADNCFAVSMEITDIKRGSGNASLTVKRNPGSGDLRKVGIVVNGVRAPDGDVTDLQELDSKTFGSLAIITSDKIEIYDIVGESQNVCAAVADS